MARALSPKDPRMALSSLGLRLMGPFDLLAAPDRFPAERSFQHARTVHEPAEFFAILKGAPLGARTFAARRWGYYLDDPHRGSGCVGSHSSWNRATIVGTTVLGTLRGMVERLQGELTCAYDRVRARERVTMLPAPASSAERIWTPESVPFQLDRLAWLREALVNYGARETESDAEHRRRMLTTAPTPDGWGLIVPASFYRDFATTAQATTKSSAGILEQGLQALRDGYPGSALKLAKDLGHSLDLLPRSLDDAAEAARKSCFELSAQAYEALDRAPLARLARWQSSVWQPPSDEHAQAVGADEPAQVTDHFMLPPGD
jgi:hypothetical protein